MAKFELSARSCVFSRSPGGTLCRQHQPLATPIARHAIESQSCDALAQALTTFRDGIAVDHSFFVSVRLVSGRAPAGFRQRTWILEVDRDTG